MEIMNLNKFILGVIAGALVTAISMAVTSYILSNYGRTNFWVLIAIYFVIYGIAIGAISGGVIIGYKLNLITATIFGLLFNLLVAAILFFLMGGGLEQKMYHAYYISVIVGAINGAVVSLINLWQPSGK